MCSVYSSEWMVLAKTLLSTSMSESDSVTSSWIVSIGETTSCASVTLSS